MLDGRVVRSVDCTGEVFRRTAAKIPGAKNIAEAKEALRALFLADLDAPPRFLHLHQLRNKEVPSAIKPNHKVNPWTIHLTRDDAYKASFTLEDGTAYMRKCDKHDDIDKNP